MDDGELRVVQEFGNKEFLRVRRLPQLVVVERLLPNGRPVVEYMYRDPDGGLGAVRD